MTKVIEIQDQFNKNKVWIVKKTNCRHYYVNQKIHGKMFYSKFTRTSLSHLKSVLKGFKEEYKLDQLKDNKLKGS